MKIFVIIVTYNPKKWLKECLNSIKNSNINLTTIIVDNGSSDNSDTIIKEDFPEVLYIQNDKNLGFGIANNIGIKKALDLGADYVLLLNQDAYIFPDTLEKLLRVSEKNQNFGILSPVHINLKGDLDWGFKNYLEKTENKLWYDDVFIKNKKHLAEVYPIFSAPAAIWFIPKKTFDKVGGFNPYFFQYGEDDEYAQRIYYHHLKIGFVPDAFAIHDRQPGNSDFKSKQLQVTSIEVKMLDPNNSIPFKKFIINRMLRILITILKLDFGVTKNIFFEIKYFLKQRKKIKFYLKENQSDKPNLYLE